MKTKKKAKELVIVGAGETALIAYEYFTYDSEYEVAGFSVDRHYLTGDSLLGRPLVPFDQLVALFPPDSFSAFVAIPASQLNRLRMRFFYELKRLGYTLASYVSSRSFVWRNAEIGENVFIFENNVIQPFTSIGDNCILWSGNHIGHRTVIRSHNFISSHVVISGSCEIDEGCFIGVNAAINDHIQIGRACLIGSGALVVRNTEPERIYVGQPARPVSGKSSYEIQL